MFRLFKNRTANIKLGRWDTNKASVIEMRLADLANCDSCGICASTNNIHDSYLSIDDDIIFMEPDIVLNSTNINKHKQI